MDVKNYNTVPVSLPIKKIIQETPFVRTYVFEYALGSKPGQFVNLWIPRVDEKPISIAYDDGKEFWLTIFAVGNMTKKVAQLKVGDLVGIRGPFGTSFEFKKGEGLVMVGGGYGAAPLFNLANAAVKQGCTVDFIVGARGKEYLLYLDRVKKLKNTKLHIATDDGSVGHKGYNTQVLEEVLKGKGKKVDRIFAVGPEMMMKRVSDIAFKAKISCQVSLERYMKCGFGICGNCVVDNSGLRTCVDGPAMDHLIARKTKDFGVYHRDSVGKKLYF